MRVILQPAECWARVTPSVPIVCVRAYVQERETVTKGGVAQRKPFWALASRNSQSEKENQAHAQHHGYTLLPCGPEHFSAPSTAGLEGASGVPLQWASPPPTPLRWPCQVTSGLGPAESDGGPSDLIRLDSAPLTWLPGPPGNAFSPGTSWLQAHLLSLSRHCFLSRDC